MPRRVDTAEAQKFILPRAESEESRAPHLQNDHLGSTFSRGSSRRGNELGLVVVIEIHCRPITEVKLSSATIELRMVCLANL